MSHTRLPDIFMDDKNLKDPSTGVVFFNSHNNLLTSLQVLNLSKELGLEPTVQETGASWVAFMKDGKPISKVAFYDASSAYAFLLGYKAAISQ